MILRRITTCTFIWPQDLHLITRDNSHITQMDLPLDVNKTIMFAHITSTSIYPYIIVSVNVICILTSLRLILFETIIFICNSFSYKVRILIALVTPFTDRLVAKNGVCTS